MSRPVSAKMISHRPISPNGLRESMSSLGSRLRPRITRRRLDGAPTGVRAPRLDSAAPSVAAPWVSWGSHGGLIGGRTRAGCAPGARPGARLTGLFCSSAVRNVPNELTDRSGREGIVAKPLVIVESPAKARTIEGFLGRGQYTVKASKGHIRDLPRSSKEVPKGVTDPDVRRLAIDVNNHFEPIWVVPDQKKDVVKELKAALKDASEVY